MSKPPRISVNDLAQFMVSSTTAQLGIVKRAKHPQTPPIIRYKDARPAIVAHLTDPARKLNPLVSAEQLFQQRVAEQVLAKSGLPCFDKDSPRNVHRFSIWNRVPRKR